MYADLVIISFIYIGNEIRATIQFLLCEAFLKSSSILLNLTEPMALIPENATIENMLNFKIYVKYFIGVGRFRILGGPMFRYWGAKGGPNS